MTIPNEGDILNVGGIKVIFVRQSIGELYCDQCVIGSVCNTGRKGFICPSHLKPVLVEDMI